MSAAYYLSGGGWGQTPIQLKSDYRNIPAQWIGYAEDSTFYCDINEPSCFAGDGLDAIYIGGDNPPFVCRFSLKDKIFQTIPLKSKPVSLAVGAEGQLFAGKLFVAHAHQFSVYSMDGDEELTWAFPDDKTAVYSIARTDSAVYAADTGKRLIHQFDGQGKLVRSFGQPLGQSGEKNSESTDVFSGFAVYISPITLTISRKTGLIHVANPGKQRIETFTSEGYWEPSLSWGDASSDLSGFAGCCNPVSVSTLSDGRIITAEKYLTRVKVFFTNGRLDCVVAGPEVLDKIPANIPQLELFRLPASENGRHVYVTAMKNDNIVFFDPAMNVIRCFVPLTTK
jgi:hypothetical protein